MLFETLLQGKIFLAFVYFGALCGIFFSAKKLIDKSLKNNKVVIATTDTIFMLTFSAIFIFAKNVYAYGEFRLYLVIAYVLGIAWEQISLNYLVEKFLNLSYNLCVRGFCKIRNNKIFGKMFK